MNNQTTFPADADRDAVTAAVMEHGYALIHDLAPDLVAEAGRELAPYLEATPFGSAGFLGARTRRTGALFRKSVAAQQLAIHDMVMGVCDQVLLPQCARYQLNFSGVMELHPGEKAQVLHRDGDLYPFRNPYPATLVQTMWAVSDFTRENGGTQVVPGSHLWDESRKPLEQEVISAEMPAGSLLIYQAGTLHGGGANRAHAPRTGIAFQYSLGWLRQEENQHLTNPPEVARHYPPRLQALVGYEYGGPYLGFVNGDDPARLLADDGYDGPALRSRPDIDAAQARVPRFRFEHPGEEASEQAAWTL